MSPPAAIQAAVESTLEETFGRSARVRRFSPVSGGCISPSARLETEAGDVAFLKWSGADGAPRGLFASEAASLAALADTRTVRVPAVLAFHDEAPPGNTEHEPDRWLLLEWLEPGRPRNGGWDRLGADLGALHRWHAGGTGLETTGRNGPSDGPGRHGPSGARYGWETDNFIGTLPQRNGWLEDWPGFWRTRRLEPQLGLAYEAGHFGPAERRRFDDVLARLDELLAGIAGEPAALLHGDLWSGNVHFLADGSPAVVDPASYYGQREVDLAMSELFGGFGSPFYRAYDEAWPLAPGYADTRRPLYQLYFLLVHVNLFGGGYVASTLDALRRIPL